MIDGGVEIMDLPTTGKFLELLREHAGGQAVRGQWGFYPGAKGELLTAQKAAKIPGTQKWIGMPVYDANALVETYVNLPLEMDAAERMKFQYEEWCYGHVGDVLEEMVQLPGGAVFKVDSDGTFRDVAYLYQKYGEGPLDWEIFVCNDPKKGLCIERLDRGWNRWGLISMVMRYDKKGPVTEKLPPLPAGTPYAVVGSSVLNFRIGPTEGLITSLPNGTVVELTGSTQDNWTEVKVGENRGFVYSKFLEKHPEG